MKLKSKSFLISFLFTLGLFALVPFVGLAQNSSTLAQISQASDHASPTDATGVVNPTTGGLVVCGNTGGASCTLTDLFTIFARVINFMLAVAGFFAIFQIARAGQAMVLAFGNPESLTTAKNSLTNAVLGFALVMVAYVLMYAVVYQFLGLKNVGLQNLFFHPIDYLTKVQ